VSLAVAIVRAGLGGTRFELGGLAADFAQAVQRRLHVVLIQGLAIGGRESHVLPRRPFVSFVRRALSAGISLEAIGFFLEQVDLCAPLARTLALLAVTFRLFMELATMHDDRRRNVVPRSRRDARGAVAQGRAPRRRLQSCQDVPHLVHLGYI